MKGRNKRRGLAIGVSAGVALLAALLCSFSDSKPKKDDLVFSHRYHVKELELECEACHEGATTEEKAGLPPEETCQACHDFDREKPSEACLTCHSSTEVKIIRKRIREYADTIFSHEKHAGLECSDCHKGVENAAEISRGKYLPSMEDCMACHGELGVSRECKTCHRVLRKEEKPSSHGAGFERSHGMLSEMKDARCTVCHQKNFCQECHLEQEPQNHTYLWKKQAHGRLSMIDRSSCKTCHRTDFCTTCHAETRPTSHRGGFGNPLNSHCQTCHLPLSASGCGLCHRTLESHNETRPGDHRGNYASTHCVGCHFPISATDCIVCHDQARHETAPDAGWHPDEWRSCRVCHPSKLTTKPKHPDPGGSCNRCHRI
jgi:hypothetical protein